VRGLGGGVDQLWGGEERIGSVPERSPGAGDPHVDDLDAGGLGEVPAEQLADLKVGTRRAALIDSGMSSVSGPSRGSVASP